MRIRLISDAGSTKCDWVILGETGSELSRISTGGINALLSDEAAIASKLAEVKDRIPENSEVLSVRYYGAGCATEAICNKMRSELSSAFATTDVQVHSDLLAAARSLLGNNPGIACILGTGSNSALYDGTKIARNVPSLGYILGDEGSGAALGKRLVSDAFKGHLPNVITDAFLDQTGLTLPAILDRVYRSPQPNAFLASLVPFIEKHLWNPYIYSLVRQEFENFFKRNIMLYEGAHSLPITFTGGIAWNFGDILREVAKNSGYTITSISRAPLDGLVKFHISEP
ncbi:MAG: ATPase [Muribaculaceae bacterium]|nr:ATPase [Muribaculaceae bacterium]